MAKNRKKSPHQTYPLTRASPKALARRAAIKKGGGFCTGQAAQEIQDEIFRKMTADDKIKLASQLWSLAKELSRDKVYYGINRSKTAFGKSS